MRRKLKVLFSLALPQWAQYMNRRSKIRLISLKNWFPTRHRERGMTRQKREKGNYLCGFSIIFKAYYIFKVFIYYMHSWIPILFKIHANIHVKIF